MDQVLPPSVLVLCQRAPVVPRTKTSILLLPDAAAAAGDEVSTPPRDFHADHFVPSQCLYQRAPVGALYEDIEAACALRGRGGPVPEASWPPRLDHPDPTLVELVGG